MAADVLSANSIVFMTEKEQAAIKEITQLFTKSLELENEIRSDDLKFSAWIAAAAAAAFGLLLLNAGEIIKHTWLPKEIANCTILCTHVLLACSVALAGIMHHLVNRRLVCQRNRINLLNAQLTRVISGQISEAGDDIAGNVIKGGYLTKEFQEQLAQITELTDKVDSRCDLSLRFQMGVAAAAYAALFAVGAHNWNDTTPGKITWTIDAAKIRGFQTHSSDADCEIRLEPSAAPIERATNEISPTPTSMPAPQTNPQDK